MNYNVEIAAENFLQLITDKGLTWEHEPKRLELQKMFSTSIITKQNIINKLLGGELKRTIKLEPRQLTEETLNILTPEWEKLIVENKAFTMLKLESFLSFTNCNLEMVRAKTALRIFKQVKFTKQIAILQEEQPDLKLNGVENLTLMETVSYIQNVANRKGSLEGYLTLSADPMDFITSSHNSYGWTTCFGIDKEQFSTTLSYMMDSTTLLLYVNSKVLDLVTGEIADKKWRTFLFFSPDYTSVAFGEAYPYNFDALIYTMLEEIGYTTITANTPEQYSVVGSDHIFMYDKLVAVSNDKTIDDFEISIGGDFNCPGCGEPNVLCIK